MHLGVTMSPRDMVGMALHRCIYYVLYCPVLSMSCPFLGPLSLWVSSLGYCGCFKVQRIGPFLDAHFRL